jgi:hypothetical protein
MRLILAVMLWACAVQAQAGAWPRAQGDVFVALSADSMRAQLYAEYGLRNDWTLGIEVSMPHKGRRLPDVTQFLHRPIWRGSGGAILSTGVATEVRETTAAALIPMLKGEREIAMRAGLFFGKGFSTPVGDGWATLDGQVEQIVTMDWLDTGLTFKLDEGVGLKPIDTLMLTVQAQYWRRGEVTELRLETGAAWQFGPAQLVAQPSVGVMGPRDARVKIGVWMSF